MKKFINYQIQIKFYLNIIFKNQLILRYIIFYLILLKFGFDN